MDQYPVEDHTRTEQGHPWRRGAVVLVAAAVAVFVLVAVVVLSSDAGSREDAAGQAIRLSVSLFIPAIILITFWYVVRRQVSRAKSDLEALSAEEQDVIDLVSHQLRDQLTVIYGFSETLLDSDLSDQTEVCDVLTVINAEAVDLSRIVDDLVSAAELKSGAVGVSLDRFDPSAEVERVVLPFRRRYHEIPIDCWSGVAVSDPIRFRQIMRSLLSNAIAHGGPEVAIVGELSTDSFRCTVADDGEGISPALAKQLFNPSNTSVSRAGGAEGLGLGITVAQAIARQLGGRLSYERSSDLTMVTLVLPTRDWPDVSIAAPPVDDSSQDAEESPAPDAEATAHTRKVERRISFTRDDDDSEVLAAAADPHTRSS